MKITRVGLVDDHQLLRAGLRSLLQTLNDIEVVGEATSGREALQMAALLRPDIILMDISMPDLNGLEATARIVKEFLEIRIIILSMHLNEAYALQAVRAGAAGYLMKNVDPCELEIAIHEVASGRKYFSSAASTHMMDYIRRLNEVEGSADVLTPRQREVLQLIAEGNTGKEIASRLNISVRTVEGHRTEIMERLGIHDVAGLVRYAVRTGLIAPEK